WTNKAGLLAMPYWTSEFVGAGPYRVREWASEGTIRLEANDDYVLGRPKIDRIDVQFIPDANTLSANLLAGAVDLTPTVGSTGLGLQLRDQWRAAPCSLTSPRTTWSRCSRNSSTRVQPLWRTCTCGAPWSTASTARRSWI